MEHEIQKQREELTRLTTAVNNTQLEIETLEAQKAHITNEVDALSAKTVEVQGQYNTAIVNRDFVLSEIEQLTAQKEQLLKDSAEVQASLQTSQVDLNNLIAEKNASIANTENEIVRLNAEKAALSQKYASQLDQTITELNGARAALKEISETISSLEGKKAAADTELRSVRDELAESSTALSAIQKDCVENNHSVIEATTKLSEINEQITLANTKLSDIESKIKDAEAALETTKSEIASLQSEKFAILDAKKSLEQKEAFIRARFKDAGVEYPE